MFGLSSTPEIVQSVINNVLNGIELCDAYQDTIPTGGKNFEFCIIFYLKST